MWFIEGIFPALLILAPVAMYAAYRLTCGLIDDLTGGAKNGR